MEEKLFSELATVSAAIAQQSKVEHLRGKSKEIVSEILRINQGVFIIAGLRGTGKTTILAEVYNKTPDALFANAEILLKHTTGLLDFLHYAAAKGYKVILLDEIHILPGWEKDVKIFYDETRGKIVLSGSSAIVLKAKGSELSRRARTFELKPFSFREYLEFQTGRTFPAISLSDIISIEKRKELEKQIQPYLNYFSPYCQFDALPAAYFEKNKETYLNILERTIRFDLVSLREVDSLYIENTFRAVKVIASSPPGELSYSKLASSLGIGVKLARQIVYSLAQSGVLYLVSPYGTGKKAVRKEEKILMPLSFRAALCSHYNLPLLQGALREDFFIQHVANCTYLKSGRERRTPDFVAEGNIFEVGGHSKNSQQIREIKNSFIVKEASALTGNELSLYLFGFLY